MFFKQLCLFCIIFLLFGCDRKPTFATLCEDHPSICQEFEEDSWCKTERIAVGFSNLNHLNTPNDQNKFNQIISYENYAECMGQASKIEHIKFKDKRHKRIGNVVKAKNKINDITKQTANSKHPDLLYFHWSRHLNHHSLNAFLALENTNALETPHLQFNLATYYAKTDSNKTLRLLYHALELTNKNDHINTEIFKSISTIFADKKKQKQAYIWSKVLAIHSPNDISITSESLKQYAARFSLDDKYLDLVATATLNKIIEGKFTAPKS